jgi:hypothetical protein
MDKKEEKGLPVVGDGLEAKAGDGNEAKPSEGIELVVVQDNAPTDLEGRLTRGSQPDWVAKICKRYSLGGAGVEELMLLLVGGCDDACGTDFEHAHDAMTRVSFQKNPLDGDVNAGVNLILSLVKDIRKETQYFRNERQKIRKSYDVQSGSNSEKAERDKVVKGQSGKLEEAAAALEEVGVQAKSKAEALARPSKNENQELIDQFDRVQLQNNSLSGAIAEHGNQADYQGGFAGPYH